MSEREVAATVALPAVRQMGPLELAAYKADWKASHIYARRVAQAASKRDAEATEPETPDGTVKLTPAASVPQASGGPSYLRRGFAALRHQLPDDEDEVDHDDGAERHTGAPTPGRVAARLLLARLFDRNPSVMRELRADAPVVIVDVPDLGLFDRVSHQWTDVLGLRDLLFADIGALSGAAGDGSGGTEGSSDLAQATRIAAALVGSFGHAGPHALVFLADHSRTHEIMDHAYLRAAAHQELDAAFEEAKRILREHRHALRTVAAHLRKRGRIDGYEVERIIAGAMTTP